MYLDVSYDKNFEDLWMHLKSKYPDKLFNMDGVGEQLDMAKFSKKFFKNKNAAADASVDGNANVDDMSVITYHIEFPKPHFKLNSYYMVWKELKRLYGQEVANTIVEHQLTGDIYINDFHGIGGGLPYCYNYSTYDIMTKGLPMIKKIKSIKPKYLYSFKSQLEQFTVIAANSTLGATGLADMLVVMSYYVNNILENYEDAGFQLKDEESAWKYIKENLVSFVYTINQPLRGNQSCFTNLSVYDRKFLDGMKDDYLFPDGSTVNVELVLRLQELFLDIMEEELERTPITFPVLTACFAVDENKDLLDMEFVKYIAEKNKKFGFINLYCGDSATLSSCCRLRSDKKNEYFNSFGAGSSKIGSLGVVTVNLPRLAIKYADNKEEFLNQLKYFVGVCAKINNAKRKLISRKIDNGNHPLYTLGFINLETQYSTVGINGFNECVEIMGHNILNEDGQAFGIELIETLNAENDKQQKKYNVPHNCEQIPGENSSVKLCNKDLLLKYHNQYEIYSNQFIPLVTEADLLDRIKLQGIFDKHFSGGAICHLNVETRIKDSNQIVELIKAAAKQGVVYFAINYVLAECENGHMTVTRTGICEICGGHIVNEYSRVVGFLTKTSSWNETRRRLDYPNRQFYQGSDI